MSINQEKRTLIYCRDNHTCAYCKSSDPSGRLEIDHIVPKSQGGSDELWNLASICRRCNGKKSNKQSGIDPLTQKEVRLYHPVDDIWEDHFKRSNSSEVVMGISPVGRATAELLKFKESTYNINILPAGEYGEYLGQIRLARRYRLENNFEQAINLANSLIKELFTYNKNKDLRHGEKLHMLSVLATQIVESHYTRSKDIEDIRLGLRKIHFFATCFIKSGAPHYAHRLHGHNLILIQQLHATHTDPVVRARLSKVIANHINKEHWHRKDWGNLTAKLAKQAAYGIRPNIDELKKVVAGYEQIEQIREANLAEFIKTQMYVLDLFRYCQDTFIELCPSMNLLLDNTFLATNLVNEDFSYDVTLTCLMNRRLLGIKAPLELGVIQPNKESLLKFVQKQRLHNEYRRIKDI